MTRTALVTGGAGFIGSHLVDALLARGWQVTVLDDLSTGSYRNIRHLLDRKDFHFVEGTVLDAGTVNRLVAESEHVYHLAAAVGVQLIVDKPLQSLVTNIRGTEIILEAAQRARAQLLVTSTSEIYGKSADGPFREDSDRVLGSPRKLRWSYSTSKAVDEILAYLYFRELGLPTIVARLFNTVGPRQTGHYGMVIPRFIGQALRGEPLTVYGDGSQSRSFTFVGDVVESLVRLMETEAAIGEEFNIAGRSEVTIRQLADRVIAMVGSSSTIVEVPFVEVFGEGFEDMARRAADPTKLESTIGFKCSTTLDQILERTIAYTRDVQAAAGAHPAGSQD